MMATQSNQSETATRSVIKPITAVPYFSMFSGVGGFEMGIGDRGECVGYSEIDKYAIQTYEKNFNHRNYGDATRIDETRLPNFELLVGGFPCQAFSSIGKRYGFNETRGTLFFDIARILRHKRPRHLVLENVKGLLSHDSGKTFHTILGVLSDLGYGVEWQLLDGQYHSAQRRQRLFIIGHLRNECNRQILPVKSEMGRDSHRPDAPKARILANTIRAKYPGNWNGTYIKEGERYRKLTPIECERLMTWPDNWTAGVADNQRWKQAGNGVQAKVVEAVITAMCNEGCLQTEGISRTPPTAPTSVNREEE